MGVSSSDDEDLFAERVRAKVRNLEEGSNDPVPELYSFNNVVTGLVARRFKNDESGTVQFDIRFRLNGVEMKFNVAVDRVATVYDDEVRAQIVLVQKFSEALATEIFFQINEGVLLKDWRRGL